MNISTLRTYNNIQQKNSLPNKNARVQYAGVSFSGNIAQAAEKPFKISESYLEKWIRLYGQTNFVKKFTTKDHEKIKKHFPVVTSVVLSSLYLVNTMRSKEIEKDRKPALMANMALVCGLSTAVGYAINKSVKDYIALFKTRADVLEHKNFKGNKKIALEGIAFALNIIIFQTMYRFIGPVVVTPIANKMTGSGQKKAAKSVEAPKTQQFSQPKKNESVKSEKHHDHDDHDKKDHKKHD